MLALLFRHFRDGAALELLVLRQMDLVDEGCLPFEHRDLTSFAVLPAAHPRHHGWRPFHVGLQGWAACRIAKFRLALFEAADRSLVPRGQLIEKTDGFHRELELDWHADIDRKDERLAEGLFVPLQQSLPVLRIGWIVNYSVPVEGSA